MPKSEPRSSTPSRRWLPLPKLQFSLARLMIIVTGIAVLLFLATKVASFFEIVLFSFVACVVPTPLVICGIYGRGDVRAFSIGALIPWIALIALRFPEAFGGFFEMIWLLTMGGVCGVVAVLTRRWVWRDRL